MRSILTILRTLFYYMADNDLLCPTGMGCIDVEVYCGTVYTYYSLRKSAFVSRGLKICPCHIRNLLSIRSADVLF